MAGHPPDGSWQSASANGQGGPEQVRMAWQPPRAQGQPHEQGQPYEHGRPYEQAPPPYEQAPYEAYPPPRQQSYGRPGEPGGGSDAQPDQHTLAWDQGDQQYAPGVPPGNAQAVHAARAASRAAAGRNKGYVASLFDFTFTSFVTPKVIKGLYVLGVAWTGLWAILIFLIGVHFGHAVFSTILFMLILDIVFVLLTLGVIRVILEFFMVQFRMNENVQALRDRGEQS